MMRYLLILPLALLFGCATEQAALTAPVDDSEVLTVGTLADANDPIEMASAPVITKATLVRRSALRALKRKRIDVETAKSLQLCADKAVNDVNAAAESKNKAAIRDASDIADACKRMLDKAMEQSK